MLSEVTRETLTNYYHHLHGVPRHQDIYPNHYRQPPPDRWNPHQQAPPVYSQAHPYIPQYCGKPYRLPQRSPSTTDLLCSSGQCRQVTPIAFNGKVCKSKSDSAINCFMDTSKGYIETVASKYSGHLLSATASSAVNNDNVQLTDARAAISSKSSLQNTGASLRDLEMQQLISRILDMYGPCVLDQLMQRPEFPNNAYAMLQHRGVPQSTDDIPHVSNFVRQSFGPRPVWPPGPTYTINTKTMQIQERGQLNTNLWSDDPSQQTATGFGHLDKVNTLRRPFECAFNIRKANCLPPQSYYNEANASNRINQYKLTQPRFEPDSMETNISPLQNYLHPTGNRVTDRLGLPYKAMAQRRYFGLILSCSM